MVRVRASKTIKVNLQDSILPDGIHPAANSQAAQLFAQDWVKAIAIAAGYETLTVNDLSAANVRYGVSFGAGLTGTLVVPAASDVKLSTVFDNGTVGTLVPSAGTALTTENFAALLSSGVVKLDLTQPIPANNTPQTLGDALNAARAQGFGSWVESGTSLKLYAADNTTVVKQFVLDSATRPMSRTSV